VRFPNWQVLSRQRIAAVEAGCDLEPAAAGQPTPLAARRVLPGGLGGHRRLGQRPDPARSSHAVFLASHSPEGRAAREPNSAPPSSARGASAVSKPRPNGSGRSCVAALLISPPLVDDALGRQMLALLRGSPGADAHCRRRRERGDRHAAARPGGAGTPQDRRLRNVSSRNSARGTPGRTGGR
jgi:hypothetical protein